MNDHKIEELEKKIIDLEKTSELRGAQLESLRLQLNSTNTMLIQIKEGILGNDFNNGLVKDVHDVKKNVDEFKKNADDFKSTIASMKIIEEDLKMLKDFKVKQETVVARGMGLLAGLTLVFNAAYSWFEHKFMK